MVKKCLLTLLVFAINCHSAVANEGSINEVLGIATNNIVFQALTKSVEVNRFYLGLEHELPFIQVIQPTGLEWIHIYFEDESEPNHKAALRFVNYLNKGWVKAVKLNEGLAAASYSTMCIKLDMSGDLGRKDFRNVLGKSLNNKKMPYLEYLKNKLPDECQIDQ